MITQKHQHTLIAIILAILICATVLWMRERYHKMQVECEKTGGKFYSISFTQNVCIDGNEVQEISN